jgi:hypothetical protein
MRLERRRREVWWTAFNPSEEVMCRWAVCAISTFGLTNQRSADRDTTARLYCAFRLARRQTKVHEARHNELRGSFSVEIHVFARVAPLVHRMRAT